MYPTEHDPTVRIPVGRTRFAIIDAADAETVQQYRWYAAPQRNGRIYARAYVPGGSTVYMHRLIMGPPRGLETDHRDNDGLNNRRSNLRVATPTQNRANSPRNGGTAHHVSKYRGVSWDKERRRWKAQIRADGVRRCLGRFGDEESAARAYDVAARGAFGEFAWQNFPAEEV